MINGTAQKIKERLSVEEVISNYIKLEKSGSNYKARCPFHNEKTPSFFVSPGRGSYYCFGCGASGDIFSFIEEFEGLDFKGALKLLADKAGIALDTFNKEEESEKDRLYRVMEEAANFFTKNLPQHPEVLEYLTSRGLNEKSISEFRIGYALNEWRSLYDHLHANKFKDHDIELAGLAKRPDDRSKAMYDRFRGRVIFPICDTSGRVIAFSGRIFEEDASRGSGQVISQAKYLNSPETPIFSKSSVLYGIDKAKEVIRKNNFSILVEGQMDLLLSHQAGYKNTVATSGTALADSTVSKENVVSNLGLIRRLSTNIVLAFDADKAGFNATLRAGRIALSLGMDVKVAEIPEGVDPADLISKSGAEAWRLAIKNSKHIIEFLLDRVMKAAGGDTHKASRDIKSIILPYVAALDNSTEKSNFINKIHNVSGVREDFLLEDLNKVVAEYRVEKNEISKAESSEIVMQRKDHIVRKILGIVFWKINAKDVSINTQKILGDLAETLEANPDELASRFEANKEDLIFEAEVFYQSGNDIEKDIDELIVNLKEELLRDKLDNKMRELHQAEIRKDHSSSAKLLAECKELSEKIEIIKNGRIK